MQAGDAQLFAGIDAAGRASLLASGMGRLLNGERVVDLFCGAGGWGAGAALLGIRTDYAVNHSPVAIEFHSLNHPTCRHHQGDAWKARPADVAGKDSKIGLLLASAACTTHSNARGAAPISPRVHMLGWCIARWIADKRPRCVLVENVSEWRHWGPTRYKIVEGERVRDAYGRLVREADPERKGTHFKRWLRYVARLGYRVEWRILDAVDYGAASRRKRLFVMMRRDGQPIVWPEATHGPVHCQGGGRVEGLRDSGGHSNSGQVRQAASLERGRVGSTQRAKMDEYQSTRDRSHNDCSGRLSYRTAAEVIDWSDLGTSVFERKRPLKDKTLARIAEGIRRFVIEDASPFVLRVTHGAGGGWKVSPIDGPLPTQTTRQDIGVVSPVITPCGGPKREPSRVSEPCNTILTREDRGIAAAVLVQQNHGDCQRQAVDEPLRTVTTQSNRHTLVAAMLQAFRGDAPARRADEPMPTITAGNGPGRGAGAGHALGLIAPSLIHLNNHTRPTSVGDPVPTVLSGGKHAGLVAAFLVQYYKTVKGNSSRPDQPLPCVVTHDRHGLVVVRLDGQPYVIVDILFRMLRPHELAAAMGFPADYIWPKTQRDAVKLIGNAVSPPMATALLGAMFPAMVPRGERQEEFAA